MATRRNVLRPQAGDGSTLVASFDGSLRDRSTVDSFESRYESELRAIADDRRDREFGRMMRERTSVCG